MFGMTQESIFRGVLRSVSALISVNADLVKRRYEAWRQIAGLQDDLRHQYEELERAYRLISRYRKIFHVEVRTLRPPDRDGDAEILVYAGQIDKRLCRDSSIEQVLKMGQDIVKFGLLDIFRKRPPKDYREDLPWPMPGNEPRQRIPKRSWSERRDTT